MPTLAWACWSRDKTCPRKRLVDLFGWSCSIVSSDCVSCGPGKSGRIRMNGVVSMSQHWARAPIERNQAVLFSPTLNDAIGEDHPVRLLDEILRRQDWSDWVKPCGDHRGRPPIHPRILAAVILYGLMRRIRSSRDAGIYVRPQRRFHVVGRGASARPQHAFPFSQGLRASR